MHTTQSLARCKAQSTAARLLRTTRFSCPKPHSNRPRMLSGPAAAGGSWPGRRNMSISALFGFKWPFGGDSSKEAGPNSDVLKNARTARTRGCPLAPKEAPEGLKLATFAGGCFWGLELAYQRVRVHLALNVTTGSWVWTSHYNSRPLWLWGMTRSSIISNIRQ